MSKKIVFRIHRFLPSSDPNENLAWLLKNFYENNNDDSFDWAEGEEGATEIDELPFYIKENARGISLPETLYYIEAGTFESCKSLREIIIKGPVKVLKWKTFLNCKELITIQLPDTLKEIENLAIAGCDMLKEIELPYGLKKIGDNAFRGCKNLETVVLPPTIEKIGKDVFFECPNLKTIVAPMEKEALVKEALENSHINNSVKIVLTEGPTKDDPRRNIVIPEGTTKVVRQPQGAMNYTDGVKLPSTLKAIGQDAFCGWNKLKSITIPEGVTVIEKGAFKDCVNLETVNLPSTLREISASAFEGCKSLKNMSIPDGVEIFGERAFEGCDNYKVDKMPTALRIMNSLPRKNVENLEQIVIRDGIEEIGPYVFANCPNAKSVSFPPSLRIIGEGCFYNCPSLVTLSISKGVTKIGKKAFKDCKNIISATISETVKSIGAQAFEGCISCRTLDIPNGVEDIGKNAFKGCKKMEVMSYPCTINSIEKCVDEYNSLKSVYLNISTPSPLPENFFDCCGGFDCEIVVPFNSYQELITFINQNKKLLHSYIKMNAERTDKHLIHFSGPNNILSFSNLLTIGLELGGKKGYTIEGPELANKAPKSYEGVYIRDPEIDSIIQDIFLESRYLPLEIKNKIQEKVTKRLEEYKQIAKELIPRYKYIKQGKTNRNVGIYNVGSFRNVFILEFHGMLSRIKLSGDYNNQIRELINYIRIIQTEAKITYDKEKDDELRKIIFLISELDSESKSQIKAYVLRLIEKSKNNIESDVRTLFDDDPFTNPIHIDYKYQLASKLGEKYLEVYEPQEKIRVLRNVINALNDGTIKKGDSSSIEAETINSFLQHIRYLIVLYPNINYQVAYNAIAQEYTNYIEAIIKDKKQLLAVDYESIVNKIKAEFSPLLVNKQGINPLDMLSQVLTGGENNIIENNHYMLIVELISAEEYWWRKPIETLEQNYIEYKAKKPYIETGLYRKLKVIRDKSEKMDPKNSHELGIELSKIKNDYINKFKWTPVDSPEDYYQKRNELLKELDAFEKKVNKVLEESDSFDNPQDGFSM